MHKPPQDTSTTRFESLFNRTSYIMRALPWTNIDFGGLGRFVLHHLGEQKAHLATHAFALLLSGGYVVLMSWLIAASLVTMRMRHAIRRGIPIAILGAVCIGFAARAHASDDPSGVWLTQAGDARIRVSRCGSELCGTVVWLKDKIDPATGQPFTDNKNPDPRLAKRPMIGLQIFLGMRPVGPGKWSGHIYNADDGKTYTSNLAVPAPSTLKVEGCVGSLCGSESWTRAH